MEVEIFYFTGTGNSLQVAKDIAKETNAKLTAITQAKKQGSIYLNAHAIGIVFPVYYGDIPVIVKEFVRSVSNLKLKYIFAVATYGGAASVSFNTLRSELRKNNGKLSATFGVHMPQNAFNKPREHYKNIYKSAQEKCMKISTYILKQRKGAFFLNPIIEIIMRLFHFTLIKPIVKRALAKYADASHKQKIDNLIHRADKCISTNDNCNGCGTCVKVCPVDNITLISASPTWNGRCENCLACYNWCPSQAIDCGLGEKNYYYLNSNILLSEIIEQSR